MVPILTEANTETLMDDVLARMASSQLSRRSSRSGSTHTPKRRSARIEKPKSTHASPRVSERRRTMNTARPYPTLEDHYRQMFGTGGNDKAKDTSNNELSHRPVSWHPSTQFSSSFYQSSSSASENTSQNDSLQSLKTTFDEPPVIMQDQFPQTDTFTIRNYSQSTPQYEDTTRSSYFGAQASMRSGPPSYSAVMNEPKSWFLPEYSHTPHELPQYHAVAMNQQNDLLPIQYPPSETLEMDVQDAEDEQPLVRQDSKELIGMGLYDDPETTPFNLLTIGGKGLKLEEGWQPPEDMINDSDDADGENDSSEEEDEPPRPPLALAAIPAAVQGAPQLPLMNMSGQSFLFDDADDDTITSDWWYQMKQPNAAAQDATNLAYGLPL